MSQGPEPECEMYLIKKKKKRSFHLLLPVGIKCLFFRLSVFPIQWPDPVVDPLLSWLRTWVHRTTTSSKKKMEPDGELRYLTSTLRTHTLNHPCLPCNLEFTQCLDLFTLARTRPCRQHLQRPKNHTSFVYLFFYTVPTRNQDDRTPLEGQKTVPDTYPSDCVNCGNTRSVNNDIN